MSKINKLISFIIVLIFNISPSISDDHEINFYSGMFDFSDDGQRALLFGLQHQNESLVRDSFLGEISPVTGFFSLKIKRHICTPEFKHIMI